MKLDNDPIETYLDELLVQLRGSPRMVRRVLAETEAHLRDAVDAGASAPDAIARFGAARDVAAASSRTAATPVGVLVRQAVLAAGLLGVVGLLAIGASGVFALGMDAAFGPKFVAGALPTVTYTASRCDEYRALAPKETSCLAAAARHHTDEVVTTRIAAGIVGLVGLGVLVFLRRRWRSTPVTGAVVPGVVPAVGACVFGVAGLALATGALSGSGFHSNSGIGQWLSASLVSMVVAGAFSVQWLRAMRHPDYVKV